MTVAPTQPDEPIEDRLGADVEADRQETSIEGMTARPALTARAASRLRRVPPIEWVGLVVCLAPIAVATFRACRGNWRPVYDSSYVVLQSLDVFGARHPFTGSWSVSDALIQDPVRTIGPLLPVLLASFTHLHPYLGAAVGVALVNALCVVATWFAARRLFSTRGVIAVMAATAVLEMSFGAPAFVDARPQHALLLPLWAMLWLTADVSRGGHRAVVPWVVATSLVLQTDFSSVYIVGAALAAGMAGFVWSHRRASGAPVDARTFAMWSGAAVATAVLLWSPTIWDQLFGTGNLGRAIRQARGESPTDWTSGAQIVADSSFGYPFWWPGSVRDFHSPWTFRPTLAVGFVVGWIVVLFEVASSSRRRRERRGFRLSVLALVFVVAAVASAARPPRGAFDVLPQSYFWLWPVSLFAAIAIAKACASLLPPTHNLAEAVAVAATVLAALALPDRYVFPTWQIAGEINAAGGRSMLGDIGATLDGIDFDLGSAVVVDDVTFRLLVPDYYNILGELRQHGLDVHFPAASPERSRLGRDRCEDGTERWRLKIHVGRQRPVLDRLDVVLAQADGDDAVPYRDEMLTLNQRMLDRIYRGDIEIDRDQLPEAGLAGEMMVRILEEPGRPHGDLWLSLFALVQSDVVEIPPQFRADFQRWSDLERADIASHVLVFLRPNYFPTDGCPE